MKAVILNGSARKEKGVTGRLVAALAAGLSSAGAEIREFLLQAMNLTPCTACLSCMHKKTGECALKDDMDSIYDALKTSDLLVVATPVYLDTMSARMKIVMDRCMCCMEPFLTRDGAGRVRHTYAWRMPKQMLLIATAGFAEMETFGPLIATFRAQADNFASRVVAEVCIPGSIALQVAPESLGGHLRLLEETGRAVASGQAPDPTVLQALNTPPFTVEEYLKISAKYESWARQKLSSRHG